MALKLIDCPACENKVSSLATSCPRCGHPIAELNVPPVPRPTAPGKGTSRKKPSSQDIQWSPMGSRSTDGPSSTCTICNIPLSQEAILQRIRNAFEQSGFSAEQSEYREGTAYTVGGLIGAENGGLVGGMTAIDKKTWNPFLVSKSGHRFMQAKVTVTSISQKSRTVRDGLAQMENDIELHVKIEKPNVPIWIMFAGGFIGMMIGLMISNASYGSEDSAYFYGFFGAVLGFIPYLIISHTAWNSTEVMNFQRQLTEAITKIAPKLEA